MINITPAMAVTALEQVVAEAGPDFVYRIPGDLGRCVYQFNDCPSCGVGRALALLGVGLDTLAEMDNEYACAIESRDIEAILAGAGFLPDANAIRLFQAFQFAQDAGRPYSEALDRVYKLQGDMARIAAGIALRSDL